VEIFLAKGHGNSAIYWQNCQMILKGRSREGGIKRFRGIRIHRVKKKRNRGTGIHRVWKKRNRGTRMSKSQRKGYFQIVKEQEF